MGLKRPMCLLVFEFPPASCQADDMKIAETVTFGGTGLNRAAEMRADVARLAEIARSGRADVLLFWCGKPLVEDAVDDMGSPRLCRLPADHSLLPEVSQEAVFMGMHDGRAIFAAELVGWEPELPEDSTIGQFVDTSRQQHPDLPENQTFTELRSVMAALSPLDAELAATAKAIMSWHASHKFCALCGNQSLMAMAGWQRDCPRCGGQHFPRTDPVVIMLITRGNNVLLGRSPGWPEGMYSLLAGFVEPGEPIEGAVRREVLEETGINVGRVAYLASQALAFPDLADDGVPRRGADRRNHA